MPNWKDYLKKAGGTDLLKQYWRVGVLWDAVWQFLLLGRTKKALEILRLTISHKTHEKLKRIFDSKIKEFDDSYYAYIEHQSSNTIWVCWWQRIENAPIIVKECHKSLNILTGGVNGRL